MGFLRVNYAITHYELCEYHGDREKTVLERFKTKRAAAAKRRAMILRRGEVRAQIERDKLHKHKAMKHPT